MSNFIITNAIASSNLNSPVQLQPDSSANITITLVFTGSVTFPATISAIATCTSADQISWSEIIAPVILPGPGLAFTITATASPCLQAGDQLNQNYIVTVTDSSSRTQIFNIGISNPDGYPSAEIFSVTNYPDPVAFAETPGPPTGLVVTPITSTRIDLVWVAPVDPGDTAITGYQIYRESPLNTGFDILVLNTGSTSLAYSDISVEAGIFYNYQISAINNAGTGALSNESSALTPTSVPDAPTDLVVAATSNSNINLAWIAPVEDGGTLITGYKIFRETPIGGGFIVLVANTGTTAVAYSDGTVAAATQYNYKVKAINVVGAGPDSNQAATTTPV